MEDNLKIRLKTVTILSKKAFRITFLNPMKDTVLRASDYIKLNLKYGKGGFKP